MANREKDDLFYHDFAEDIPGYEGIYQSAIEGHTINGVPVYDYDALVRVLKQLNGWDEYTASAWIDHNFTGVPGAPIIIRRLEE